jgi:hypothetical protein
MKAYFLIAVAVIWAGGLVWLLFTGGYGFGVDLPMRTPHWLTTLVAATVFSLVEFGWLIPLAMGIHLLNRDT